VNTATPIDVASGQDVGSTATPSTAAVTTTSANDLVAAIFVNYDTATWTAGSGMTKRLDSDGSEVQDLAQVNAGSTGTRTATASVNGPTTAQIVALKPR
jgi:hypothetical protein